MGGISRRRLLVCGALGGVAAAAPAQAQSIRPRDIILDGAQTVELEHEDRAERLLRATRRLGVFPEPRFQTTRVPASRMPAGFRVETPVLRISFSERTFFDTARHAVLESGRQVVDAMAAALRGEAPDTAVFVAGHTDSRGSEPYNYNLSVLRADAVAEALLTHGAGDVVLWRVGFGESVPLYPNDSAENMAFNRRVEFLLAARIEPVLDVLARQYDAEEPCYAPNSSVRERCQQAIERRPVFEAIRVGGARSGTESPGRPSTRLGTRPPDRRTLGGEAVAESIGISPRRVTIDLVNRTTTMDVPNR